MENLLKEENIEFSSIESLIKLNLDRVAISDDSLCGIKTKELIPDNSILKALELKLKPQYMNDVYTWANIVKALISIA